MGTSPPSANGASAANQATAAVSMTTTTAPITVPVAVTSTATSKGKVVPSSTAKVVPTGLDSLDALAEAAGVSAQTVAILREEEVDVKILRRTFDRLGVDGLADYLAKVGVKRGPAQQIAF